MKLKPGDIVTTAKYINTISVCKNQYNKVGQHGLKPEHMRTPAGSFQQGEIGVILATTNDSNHWGGVVMILTPRGEYGWVRSPALQELNE